MVVIGSDVKGQFDALKIKGPGLGQKSYADLAGGPATLSAR